MCQPLARPALFCILRWLLGPWFRPKVALRPTSQSQPSDHCDSFDQSSQEGTAQRYEVGISRRFAGLGSNGPPIPNLDLGCFMISFSDLSNSRWFFFCKGLKVAANLLSLSE